jgi:transposase-like protein
MTEHLGAQTGEQTIRLQAYRNGSHQRRLTIRVGTLDLEMPHDLKGTFQTELFERYQRKRRPSTTPTASLVRRPLTRSKCWKTAGKLRTRIHQVRKRLRRELTIFCRYEQVNP